MVDAHEPSPKAGTRSGISRVIGLTILFLVILAGIIALILYLVYRPSQPRFSVGDVFSMGISKSTDPFDDKYSILGNISVGLVIRNPNSRVSIRYDRVELYVTYHNEPITAPVPLSLLTQDKDTSADIYPNLGGINGTVPYYELEVSRYDEAMPLQLIAVGRIRYDPGPFHGWWSSLHVRCNVRAGAVCRVD